MYNQSDVCRDETDVERQDALEMQMEMGKHFGDVTAWS